MLASLAGLINAIGFLAFCKVCLGAPQANITVLGASLPEGLALAQFAAGMTGSFVMGIVFTTLITYRSDQYRRTVALACTAITLIAADLTFRSQIAIIPTVFLAMAMGGALCILERGELDRRLAMSPSAPKAWFGQGRGLKRFGVNHRQTGFYASIG